MRARVSAVSKRVRAEAEPEDKKGVRDGDRVHREKQGQVDPCIAWSAGLDHLLWRQSVLEAHDG